MNEIKFYEPKDGVTVRALQQAAERCRDAMAAINFGFLAKPGPQHEFMVAPRRSGKTAAYEAFAACNGWDKKSDPVRIKPLGFGGIIPQSCLEEYERRVMRDVPYISREEAEDNFLKATEEVKSEGGFPVPSHLQDAIRYMAEQQRELEIPMKMSKAQYEAKRRRDAEKRDKKEKDSMRHRTWDYELAHPDMLCVEEIIKYATRNNPLVVVKTSQRVTEKDVVVRPATRNKPAKVKDVTKLVTDAKTLVIIHHTIITKATMLNVRIPAYLKSTDDGNYWIGESEESIVAAITKWVKDIKAMPWGDTADRKVIRVMVPKV